MILAGYCLTIMEINLRVTKGNRHSAQQGFTMIEVLIAFVILSIGLLGIVSLMVMSKSAQHQSIQRARAVNMADAIVERIRINPSGLPIYNIGDSALGGETIDSEPSPDCQATACDPNELAAHDLWSWEQVLDGATATIDGENVAGLVSPRGCIQFTPFNTLTRSGLLNVTVQWRGLEETTDALQDGDFTCGGETAGTDDFRRGISVNTVVLDEAEF